MSTLVYWTLWIIVNLVSRLLFHYRTRGDEHIPKTGGVVFAANHASYADIPLLGCGVRRRLWFLGRSTLFPNPLVGWILRSLGWIPLRTDRLDRKALGQAIALVKAGKPVVIFPEGTRTPDGTLQPGKPGIGVIVAETGCPVIPVYIQGTYQVLPLGASCPRLHPVEVRFGKPIDFGEMLKQNHQGKTLYIQISQTVMAQIAELGHVGQSGKSA
ncbi:MAG: 1-acyl-sn-glycerol-3-phosphate acyltransferase [Nitrospirae bacterium]|nr:MAG: 1-acyl-sn-glycerol-3-phosphate acyltransferase [Nitrospirota bacterium]